MRRVAAPLTLITALAVTGILWMMPVDISVLGTTGACGPAVIAAVLPADHYGPTEMDASLAASCRAEGLPLSIVGGIVGVAGIAAAMVLWITNPKRWPNRALEFRVAVMALHQRDGQGLCVSCRVPWQCRTAQAVQVTLSPETVA